MSSSELVSRNTKKQRQYTFEKYTEYSWPLQYSSAQQLIDAGFSYAPTKKDKDFTFCLTCKVQLSDWKSGENPYEEHLRFSPDCAWMKEQQQQIEEARQEQEKARVEKERLEARFAEEARIEKERLEAHIAEEARIEKERLEAFACRRCPAKFPSNTKLHQHVQDHHQKRPATPPARKPAEPLPTPPPSEPTSPASKPTAIQAPPTPPATPSTEIPSPADRTLPATPRKQISWAQIASKPASPKPSRLPRPVPKFLLSPTPTPTTKAYLTMDDLFAMFAGKPKPLGLRRRQKGLLSPKDWRPSKPIISRQTRITSYFLPSSNSFKSGAFSKAPSYLPNQASAPRRRPFSASTPPLCGQIINSAPGNAPEYHSPYEAPKAFKNGLFKAPHQGRLSPAAICLPSPPPASPCSSRICRFCNGSFSSNNGLHQHLRSSHLSPTSRRRHEKTWDT